MKVRDGRLASNATALLVAQAANFVIPLLMIPFLTRTLGIEQFGLLAFVQAFAAYFVLCTDYGFNLSATRAIAATRENHQDVRRIVWTTMAARSILGAGCLVVMFTAVLAIPRLREDAVLYTGAALAILSSMITPHWYFQAMELANVLVGVQLATRALSAVAIFLTVSSPEDAVLVLVWQGLGLVAAGVGAWLIALRMIPVRPIRVTAAGIIRSYREGWYVFFSSAAISLYTNSNVVVLGLLGGYVQAGYFSVAEKIVRAGASFVWPIAQAVYPRVASLASSDQGEAFVILRRTALVLAGGGLAVTTTLTALPHLLVNLLAGPGWQAARFPVLIMGLVPLAVSLSAAFGVLTMLNFGLERQYAWIVAAAGVVNLAALVPGSYFLGANGAALAVVVSEVIVVVLMAVELQRKTILRDLLQLSVPGKRRIRHFENLR
jgi:O-antigen/teichoic acid export membrane protein